MTRLERSHLRADRPDAVVDVTLGQVLREAAEAAPERVALVDGRGPHGGRRRWTYAALLAGAEQIAQLLLTHFEPGERVAVVSQNCAEWVLLHHGASLARIPLVPLNPALTDRELEVIFSIAEVAGVFATTRFRDVANLQRVRELGDRLDHIRLVGSLEEIEAEAAGIEARRELPSVSGDDVLLIQFTSGTTGVPKGAVLRHRGIINNARFVAERAEFPVGGVWVNAMPMFHAGGASTCRVGCLAHHGTFVLAEKFDPGQLLELIESEGGNTTMIVPTMILAMLQHPTFSQRDVSSLITVLSGATDVPASLVVRTREEMGCRVAILYGQSEMSGVVTMTRPDDSVADQSETVGRPLPGIELKIASPEDGMPTALGEVGEICIRGYAPMIGYLGMPEATAATLDADGWLHSGDLGTLDARGFVRVTGRLKDMIIRGGMNVYPREIEDVLFNHPHVTQVSVVGIPDETYGEIVCAVLIATPGQTLDDLEPIEIYCRERLAFHKIPRRWYVVEEFPQTASGKIQKFAIRDAVIAGDYASAEVGVSI